jgi:hypothetical protein
MKEDIFTLFLCAIAGLLILWFVFPCGKKQKKTIKVYVKPRESNYVVPWNHLNDDSNDQDCQDNTCCRDGICKQNSSVVNDKYDIEYYKDDEVEPLPYSENTKGLSPLDLTDFYTPNNDDNYYVRENRDAQRVQF